MGNSMSRLKTCLIKLPVLHPNYVKGEYNRIALPRDENYVAKLKIEVDRRLGNSRYDKNLELKC